MPPTARAGANQTIAFADLPQSVSLDGTASTASAGSIIAWDWRLLDKPAGSAASLTGATTATPSFTMDVPGGYRFLLIVQQTDLTYSQDPLDPDVAFQAPMDMPTAITEATGTTEFAALSIPALGERHSDAVGSPNDLMGKWRTLFLTVDALAGIEPAGSQQATRWVTAEAGPAEADGSASNPFNATSAATNSFAGPWNQAKASLIADSTPATLGYTIIAYPGAYDEDLNITADRQWNINWLGNCTFDALNDFIFIGTTGTNLVTSPLADGSSMTFGRVGLGNPVAHSWYWFARASAWASVNVSGTLLAGVQASFEQCFCTANFNLPNLTVNYATGCTFGTGASDFTAGLVTVATGCTFSDDLTLSTASSTGGFYDCTFTGTPLFTGPANSARFDGITAARFEAASGTYAGGAGKADFLTQTVAILNVNTTGHIATDEIQERTAANGVLVDQVLLQDTTVRATRVYTSGGNDLSLETAGIAVLLDESAQAVLFSDPIQVNVINQLSGSGGVQVDGQLRGYFYGSTTTQTLSNPTVFTAFNTATCTIPAVVQANDRIRVSYTLYAEGGAAGQLDHQVKFGSVVVFPNPSNPASALGIDDAGNIASTFIMRVPTAGASSVLDVHPSPVSRDGPSPSVQAGGGSMTLSGPDFTASVVVTVEAMFGSSNAGNTTTLYDLNVEILRPT